MTTLRRGDCSHGVLELQWLLRATGHDPGPLDGVFGPRTVAAVSAHLTGDAGWPIDGEDIDDDEWAKLRACERRPAEMPRMLTPIVAVDMRIALTAGYFATHPSWGHLDLASLPVSPSPIAVRVALAQLCVEHGCEPWGGSQTQAMDRHKLIPADWLRPKAGEMAYGAVWGNNIGNRQVRADDRGFAQSGPEMPTVPWFAMSPVEGSGATAHRVTSAHYAYPNAAEGAAAYWRFLRDHCGPALAAFEAGDPAAAAHELKVGVWHYSGDEDAYARAMVDRFRSTAP